MNLTQLYQDYNIEYLTEGNKHCAAGWINTHCCFCAGERNYHLGYNLSEDYYHCWRCGGHSAPKVISKLIGVTESEAKKLLRKYKIRISVSKEPVVKIRAKAHKLPSGVGIMKSHHRKYLAKRGFDPEKLEREWNLFGTGPVSLLDGIDYKHRIIAPIYWDNEQVTFQARDISDRHALKYMACPKDRELIHHKHILYGKQSKWKETGICVEGMTDVWRLGERSFATFGIQYTPMQLRLIAKLFKRVAVIFDDDPQAIKQSNKLVSELRFRGVQAWEIEIDGDPGSMEQDDADYLTKNLLS